VPKKKKAPVSKSPAIKSESVSAKKQAVADEEKPEIVVKGADEIAAVPFNGNPDAVLTPDVGPQLKTIPSVDGKRGPDKKLRKVRKDKGVKKITPAEEVKKEIAVVQTEVEEEIKESEAPEDDLRLSPHIRAQLFARAIVNTTDASVCRFLGPRMSAGEKAMLVDSWYPAILDSQGRWGPWSLAISTTILVFLPRLVLLVYGWFRKK